MLALVFVLFDLGAFVVDLSDLLTKSDVTLLRTQGDQQTLIVKKGDKIKTVRLGKKTVTGADKRVGEVFRLSDGRLVFVEGKNP